MELIDVNGDDRVVYKSNTVTITGSDGNINSSRLNSCQDIKKAKLFIFRYAPWISLVEGVILFCLLVYLFASSPDTTTTTTNTSTITPQPDPRQSPSDPNQRQPSDSFPSSPNVSPANSSQTSYSFETLYRSYTNGTASVKLAPSLALYCTQRRHDIRFGVECQSRDVDQFCSQILDNDDQNKQSDGKQWTVFRYTTSKAGLRLQQNQVSFEQADGIYCLNDNSWNDACRVKAKLDIDLDQRKQKIVGWGGALTDSSLNNILSLTTNGTLRLLDDYFGPKGLRYNMIRITIGGSDFSSRFYTNDDIKLADGKMAPPGANDLSLKGFQLSEEDLLYKIPVLRHVLNQYQKSAFGGQIKILGSMWSPPLWMKTNHHHSKGSMRGSISDKRKTDGEEYFAALAKIMKNFLLAYRNNSINLWGFTVVNEPFFAIEPFIDFNTMIFPQKDYENYIAKYLGPTLKDDYQFRDLVLLVHDDNRRYLLNFTEPTLANPAVLKYINGVATHGYVDEEYYMMDKIYNNWKPRSNKGNFTVISTELCSGHLPFMQKALIGNWHRGVHYGLDIIRTLQHSGSGWIDWNMALDTTGGPGWLGGRLDSPVIVEKTRDMYYKSPMYYVLGQFSRHIPAGSLKLITKSMNSKFDYHFETVTFLHADGKRVTTVVLNNNPYTIQLHVRIKTSDALPDGRYYPLECSPNSVTTFVMPKSLGALE